MLCIAYIMLKADRSLMSFYDKKRESFAVIFQLGNKLQTFLDRHLKQDNITAKQFFMMIILGSFENGIANYKDLSERFGTSYQNVKQIALKLEKNGYVTIKSSKNDLRAKEVGMTKRANEYWIKRNKIDDERIEQMFENISEEHLVSFKNTLEILLNNLKKMEEKQQWK